MADKPEKVAELTEKQKLENVEKFFTNNPDEAVKALNSILRNQEKKIRDVDPPGKDDAFTIEPLISGFISIKKINSTSNSLPVTRIINTAELSELSNAYFNYQAEIAKAKTSPVPSPTPPPASASAAAVAAPSPTSAAAAVSPSSAPPPPAAAAAEGSTPTGTVSQTLTGQITFYKNGIGAIDFPGTVNTRKYFAWSTDETGKKLITASTGSTGPKNAEEKIKGSEVLIQEEFTYTTGTERSFDLKTSGALAKLHEHRLSNNLTIEQNAPTGLIQRIYDADSQSHIGPGLFSERFLQLVIKNAQPSSPEPIAPVFPATTPPPPAPSASADAAPISAPASATATAASPKPVAQSSTPAAASNVGTPAAFQALPTKEQKKEQDQKDASYCDMRKAAIAKSITNVTFKEIEGKPNTFIATNEKTKPDPKDLIKFTSEPKRVFSDVTTDANLKAMADDFSLAAVRVASDPTSTANDRKINIKCKDAETKARYIDKLSIAFEDQINAANFAGQKELAARLSEMKKDLESQKPKIAATASASLTSTAPTAPAPSSATTATATSTAAAVPPAAPPLLASAAPPAVGATGGGSPSTQNSNLAQKGWVGAPTLQQKAAKEPIMQTVLNPAALAASAPPAAAPPPISASASAAAAPAGSPLPKPSTASQSGTGMKHNK